MAVPRNWQRQLLRGIGAPITPANLQFLNEWHQREGGGDKNDANFNPLNTTQGAPGSSSMNSVGVKRYRSGQQGIRATVQTLLNGYYNDIVGGLRSGKATSAQLASSPSLKKWGTGTWGSSPVRFSAKRPVPADAGIPDSPEAGLSLDAFKSMAAAELLNMSAATAAGAPPSSSGLVALALAQRQVGATQSAPRAQTRPVAPAGGGGGRGIHELFYDPLGGIDEGKQIGAIGGHGDHVHMALAKLGAQRAAIAKARKMGLRVDEESDFDVAPVHTSGSWHYRKFKGTRLRKAADISGTAARMAAYYRWVAQRYQ
jgi:hypothetical protein